MADYETISVWEVLKIMNNGEPFSIVYYSYSKTRKTGGDIISHKQARLSGVKANRSQGSYTSNDLPIKKTNHKDNMTRNVEVLADGVPAMITKLHFLAIDWFNGKKVYI